MSQAPFTGSLEQVLRFLQLMGQSSAYTTEVNALIANVTQTGVLTYSILDANNASTSLDLADTQFPSMAWVPTSFANVAITDGLRIEAPFPRLVLVGMRGSVQRALGGDQYRLDQGRVEGYDFLIDAVVIVSGDEPQSTERKALIMADAFERLVYRNPQLGGLVELIEADGPPAPASAPYGSTGTIAGALLRFSCRVLRVV